jgi:D-proline reductase (dithiol) PrdB
MNGNDNVVDGFSFMPPSLSAWIKKSIPDAEFGGDIPWTALKKPISETTFSLMTSAGISRRTDSPFDMEREKREPAWGDPTHREIPSNSSEADIDANHLHINTAFIKDDINVMLPLARFGEFEREGIVGSLAPTSYSYYGFQLDPKILIGETMPRVAAKMREEGVEAVLLTPA